MNASPAPVASSPPPARACGELPHGLIHELDTVHARAGRAHRDMLALVATLDRTDEALATGELSIDKVGELCRFATSETESRLLGWAEDVSCATIRRRGDAARRVSSQETEEAERARHLSWWYLDEGTRMSLEAELPAPQGAVVVKAIERMTERVPRMPAEDGDGDGPWDVAARRADALVAICGASIAADPDQDRASVIVHVQAGTGSIDAAHATGGNGETDDGAILPRQSLERLLCDARVQTLVENAGGEVLGLGRMRREPPAWMLRQVRHRDRGCRFPGCDARAFTQAHHIVWWSRGGRTDLDNLVLLCSFHHRLLHEWGWSIERDPGGQVRWFRRDGRRYPSRTRAAPGSRA